MRYEKQRAIAADSEFADRYAAASFLYQVGSGAAYTPLEAYSKGIEWARRAVALDPGNAEARTTLGWATAVIQWDWETAKREIDLALKLSPSSAIAHDNAMFYWVAQGDLARGLKEAREVGRLDPSFGASGMVEVMIWVALGQPDSAIAAQARLDELNPGFLLGESWVSEAYRMKGLLDTALVLDRRASMHEHHVTAGTIVSLMALGRRAEARAAYRQMIEENRHAIILPEMMARAALAVGERDTAIAWLEKATDMHSDMSLFPRVYTDLRALRSDPRYQRLMERMHLPP